MAILSAADLHETPSRIFVPFQLTERTSAGFRVVPVIDQYDYINDLTALRGSIQRKLSDIKPEDHVLLNSYKEYIVAETIATALHHMSTVKCFCHRFPEQYEEIEIGV